MNISEVSNHQGRRGRAQQCILNLCSRFGTQGSEILSKYKYCICILSVGIFVKGHNDVIRSF